MTSAVGIDTRHMCLLRKHGVSEHAEFPNKWPGVAIPTDARETAS